MSEVIRFKVFMGWADGGDQMCVKAVDFDAEHALRLAAERQLGELRHTLPNSTTELVDLRIKLDTAMTLLRVMRRCELDHVGQWRLEIDALLNTTGTEGKDNE